MSDITDFSIKLLTSYPIIVIGSGIVLFLLGVLLYLKTTPPISPLLKILLMTLRLIAMLLIIISLLEPVIDYNRIFERKKRAIVLIDRSDSMNHEEFGMTRHDRADSLLSSSVFQSFASNVELTFSYFADSLYSSDKNRDHTKTALGDVLKQVSNLQTTTPYDYWFLFSDGRSNSGQDPAIVTNGLQVAVHTVDISNDVSNFDLFLDKVDFDPVTFVGKQSEIKVRFGWRSSERQRVQIRLRDNSNKIISENSVLLSQKDGFSDVSLRYIPVDPGRKILRLELQSEIEEENTRNNNRSIATRVMKSKLAILVAASTPDNETGFLLKYLRQQDKYDVTFIVPGSNSSKLAGHIPTRQTELNRYDLIILSDIIPAYLKSYNEQFQSFISERGGAVWMLTGNNARSNDFPNWLNELMPLRLDNLSKLLYGNFKPIPVEGQLFHPSIRLSSDRTSIRKDWAEIAEFEQIFQMSVVDSNSIVLLETTYGSNQNIKLPVLSYKRNGAGKFLTLTASPIWPWWFEALGYGEDNQKYQRFLDGLITWLTLSDDSESTRIEPEKEVFSRGELVRFNGFAFDQGFRPIPGVTGSINLKGSGEHSDLSSDFIQTDDGKYLAELPNVAPGTYTFQAVLEKEGFKLTENDGVIRVESYSLEEFDLSGDPGTLMAISKNSAGTYTHYKKLNDLIGLVNSDIVKEKESSEYLLWGKNWVLILFIGLLAAEWLFRKRAHLL